MVTIRVTISVTIKVVGVKTNKNVTVQGNNEKSIVLKKTPPLGIEPRTWRLTAGRYANGALKA